MNKPEQKFCTDLIKWLNYNIKEKVFISIEAKISEGNTPFNYKSGFKPHQIPTLQKIKHRSLGYKISDIDMTSRKPVDIIFAREQIALVAIKWIKRNNNFFYLIDPDTIQGEIDDGKKSLTEERAEKICVYKGELKKLAKVSIKSLINQ